MPSHKLLHGRLVLAGGILASALASSMIGQNEVWSREPSRLSPADASENPPRPPLPLTRPRHSPRTIDREPGNWTSIGPEGAEVLKVAVAKANQPNTGSPVVLYVTTRNSGVLRSADGGESWIGANGGLTVGPMTSLALHQERVALGAPVTIYQTTLYAASATSGIFRSTDDGSNWTSISGDGTGLEVFDLATDELGTVYAATSTGLFKSLDGGDSWRGPLLASAYPIAIDPIIPSRLFTASGSDLFRSDDGGATWMNTDLISQPNSGRISGATIGIDPFDPSTIFVKATVIPPSPYGVPLEPSGWVTRTGGANWIRDDAIVGATDFVFPEANTVLASWYDIGVLRTNDHGRTWVPVSGGLPTGSVLDLALDPLSPHIVYAATSNGVYLHDIHPN